MMGTRPAGIERDWSSTYQELRRIYDHRVAEMRDQQGRVASILTVNGLILAFVVARPVASGPRGFLQALALALLASAIIFSVLALWPRIKVSTPAFLDPKSVFRYPDANVAAQELATALKEELDRQQHVRVMSRRRVLIRMQLACIAAAAVLIALISFASVRTS